MAAIKKRALAEYQSQVAEEDKETSSPETKRLKLALRSESILPVLDTELVSSREVLENIIAFKVSSVPSHSSEVVAVTLKRLGETVSKEKDDCVRAALVNLWGDILGVLSSEELPARLEEFLSLLPQKSNKVLVSWLAALKKIVNLQTVSKGERSEKVSIS